MSISSDDSKYYQFLESDIHDIRDLTYEEKYFECETWKQEALHWKNLYESTRQSIIKFSMKDKENAIRIF